MSHHGLWVVYRVVRVSVCEGGSAGFLGAFLTLPFPDPVPGQRTSGLTVPL